MSVIGVIDEVPGVPLEITLADRPTGRPAARSGRPGAGRRRRRRRA
jgi:hypothetical protein